MQQFNLAIHKTNFVLENKWLNKLKQTKKETTITKHPNKPQQTQNQNQIPTSPPNTIKSAEQLTTGWAFKGRKQKQQQKKDINCYDDLTS